MKGICIFCTESFTDSSDVSATVCGHTFHRRCLTKWLSRSETCPQCRRPLNASQNDIYLKLYFNPGDDDESGGNTEDVCALLRARVSDLENQNKEVTKELAEVKQKLADQVETMKTLQATNEGFKENAALEFQLKLVMQEAMKATEYKSELAAMKLKLKKLEVFLNGTPEETQRMLAEYGQRLSVQEMATLCVLLRKNVVAASKSQSELTQQLELLDQELVEAGVENGSLAKKVTDLAADLSRSAAERKQLKKGLQKYKLRLRNIKNVLNSRFAAVSSESEDEEAERNGNVLENAAVKKRKSSTESSRTPNEPNSSGLEGPSKQVVHCAGKRNGAQQEVPSLKKSRTE